MASNMNVMKTSKQQERKEKKKKKLLALASLVQMNDGDKRRPNNVVVASAPAAIGAALTAPSPEETMPNAVETCSPDDDDGFVKVTHKKKSTKSKSYSAPHIKINLHVDDEPHPKRVKLKADNDDSQASDASNGSSSTAARNEDQSTPASPIAKVLTDEQYKEIRRQLRQRKRELENVPALRLRDFGQRASLQTPQDQRTPIFLTDIQHLLMAALIGKKSPCAPDRWCFLEKPLRLSHSVVLILEGMSLYHYLSHESKFTETNGIFETRLEVVLPRNKESSIIEQMAQVPLTNVQAQQLIERHGSLESAIEMNKDPTLLVKAIFPVSKTDDSAVKHNLPPNDKFPRTKLLLSALQMVDEGYPMPLRGELSERFKDYVFTQEQYQPVTDHSPMFGIDCEMCRTIVGYNELTRISIVNEQLETVYETLVMPTNKIIDYLTPYSGITPEIMKTVTKSLKDVQRDVRELLPPDAILVGQSLNFDLNAMKMMHPYVIDTSMCFNLSGLRRRKSKLQTLAMTFLKEAIQENEDGHDSVEDSLASLKLVKMKLANSLEYGDEILIQKKRLHDIIRMASGDNIKNNLFAHASQRDKRSAIITAGTLHEQIKQIVEQAEQSATQDALKTVSLYELESNKRAVNKAREIALEHSLTITNLCVAEEDLHMEAAEQTMEKIDKWIGKMWKTVAFNGMFLVLMGGSSECPSGVAKIAIKKHATAVNIAAAATPVTI